MFVTVAIPIPSEKTFSYAVPETLAHDVSIGKRVLVPFGKRRVTGYIIELAASADYRDTKEIIEIVDKEPLFHEEDLRFYRWVADYCVYPLGKMLGEVIATGGGGTSGRPAMVPKKERYITLNAAGAPHINLTKKQASLVAFIGGQVTVPISRLRKEFGNASPVILALARKNIITISEREIFRSPGPTPDWDGRPPEFDLNDDQRNAVNAVQQAIASGVFSPILLHGITGSGKTEVYIHAIMEALKRGGGVIVLVPEIALTPQLLFRFQKRFGGQRLAILHSGISRTVRYDQWRLIERGDIRIAVGARSALFAPVKDLRLIIVDEEHDTSYKQDEKLCYNARDAAVMKAKLRGATVVLGSATPAIQTYFNCLEKKYQYIALPKRIEDRPLPPVEIVDMRAERLEHVKGPFPVLSRTLRDALGETLAAGKQALLFLNRRGFHSFMLCRTCGYVFTCRNCELSLTHHASEGTLKCHYCDFATRVPSQCPQCQGRRIGSYGVGTEKLEEEVKSLYPSARVTRMDSDTTAREGAYEAILRALRRHEIDVLVGTQMIAKGHDFPGITLVGVVSADTALNIPDFRAAEKTFQILTQVSGRGGRGDVPGAVIVQTFNPDHYAIQCARQHDYFQFYREEYPLRKALFYPPCGRLVNILISSPDREQGRLQAEKLGSMARELALSKRSSGSVEITGPAEAPIAKIRGRYRWQLLLKGGNARVLNTLARDILSRSAGERIHVRVDVDPMNFL